ncbi:ATP-binding protein [Azospirillum sp. sgz301742]
MGKRLEVVLTNDVAELHRLASEVDAFVESHGLPMAVAFRLNLCFDELITNTVSYGYPGGGAHAIRVRLEADGREIHAEVEDDATAYDPFSEAPPPDLSADVETRRVGGLGVFLVRQSVDRATYRRADGRNLVRLTISVPP